MKVLIIGPSWIGDMVMSHSLYQTLKNKYKNIIIDVITPKWCKAVLSFMPEVNNIITIPFNHGELFLKKRYVIGKKLSTIGYDRAYILPNSFKSALIPFFAGIKRRIGWLGEMRYGLINDLRVLNKQKLPSMVERYIALADKNFLSFTKNKEFFFKPKIKIEKQQKINIKKKFSILNNRLIIGFCYGAEFGLFKCWPYYHYALLAKLLIADGYQIILLGSNNDKIQGENIIKLLSSEENKYCKNLTGITELTEAIIVISNCNAIISNDSGLMHITAALNLPMIVLYGITNPKFTPPLSNNAKILKLDIKYKKINIKKNKKKYHKSLINIDPAYVYKEIKILLKNKFL